MAAFKAWGLAAVKGSASFGEAIVAPGLRRLVRRRPLLGGKLGEHQVEIEIAHPGRAREQMPFGGLHRIGLHRDTIGIEAREPVLGDRIALLSDMRNILAARFSSTAMPSPLNSITPYSA